MAVSVTAATGAASALTAQARPPVIDVHLHALAADAQGPPPLGLCFQPEELPLGDASRPWPELFMAWQKDPPCDDPVWSPESDEALMRETLDALRRLNVTGVLSGPPERVRRWSEEGGERIIRALPFQIGRDDVSPDSLRRLYEAGAFAVFAEVTNQYAGIGPSDTAFDPYLAVAEELDIPVGIHIGTGPPGAPYLGFERYRAALHSPLLLEEALLRHPRLRVYVMHAGWPMLDDLLALLWAHPQLYVGIGVIDWALPRKEFYRTLRTLVEAGFGKRIMYGSDQMVWPGMIERSIGAVEDAPFLTEEQVRDILYRNAVRFFRLDDP
ncbi:MAG: amidohydrolase family protein [Gemmatimonadota bacterium]